MSSISRPGVQIFAGIYSAVHGRKKLQTSPSAFASAFLSHGPSEKYERKKLDYIELWCWCSFENPMDCQMNEYFVHEEDQS